MKQFGVTLPLHISVEKWLKMQTCFYVSWKQFPGKIPSMGNQWYMMFMPTKWHIYTCNIILTTRYNEVHIHNEVHIRLKLIEAERRIYASVNYAIIGPDNALSPDRRQAIIRTNAGILLIGPLGTNFSEIFIEIHTFSFNKIHLKISYGKWRTFCLCPTVFNDLTDIWRNDNAMITS